MVTFMLSYSQNREDVLLNRLFPAGHRGFYIDVGANDPFHCSVTAWFYSQGWSGVNIEPSGIYKKLNEARPRDVNLNVAISEKSGTATFFEFPGRTTDSTLSAEVASVNQQTDPDCIARTVQTLSLADLCTKHVGTKTIDFMSIDVEGHEMAVIGSANWRCFRPRVVVVESTRPHSPILGDLTWEKTLLENDYLFANFDGLNRFYVRKEDAAFLEKLKTPVCVFDEFACARHHAEVQKLRDIIGELQSKPIRFIAGHLLTTSTTFARRAKNYVSRRLFRPKPVVQQTPKQETRSKAA